jgi:hypothetical protein
LMRVCTFCFLVWLRLPCSFNRIAIVINFPSRSHRFTSHPHAIPNPVVPNSNAMIIFSRSCSAVVYFGKSN